MFAADFPEEFLKPRADFLERGPACRRDAVKAASGTAFFLASSDPTIPFHGAQQGIERAGADDVAMMAQLLEHPVPEEIALLRMMKHMHPEKAGEHTLEGFV